MLHPVVFTDFDGVLVTGRRQQALKLARGAVSSSTSSAQASEVDEFDPDAVARLNTLTSFADAAIVISSSWRWRYGFADLRDILRSAGVTGLVVGALPRHAPLIDEIHAWLAQHPAPSWVLIEDCGPREIGDRLIATSWTHGLQDHHVAAAVLRLAKP
jgi:hypothetical protein